MNQPTLHLSSFVGIYIKQTPRFWDGARAVRQWGQNFKRD